MASYAILNQIEMQDLMVKAKRASIGSKYFPADLHEVLGQLEIGQGIIVPYFEGCTRGYHKGQLVYYVKKAFGNEKDFQLSITETGIGIMRVK